MTFRTSFGKYLRCTLGVRDLELVLARVTVVLH